MASADLAFLPKFPCRLDKRPLVPNGFYNARRNIDTEGWPLAGVPSGKVSGIDCVDLDPEGIDWYDQNFDALPFTRAHSTPRGLHLLFKHSLGLRCCTNRIAEGVDVRSTGGYFIWWPRQNLPFEDDPLCEMPDWLLAMAMRPSNSKRNRRGKQSIEGRVLGHGALVDASLRLLAPTEYQNYDDWWELMAACNDAGIGKEAFVEWSTTDPKYANDGDEIGELWDALKPGGGITSKRLRVEIRLAQLNRGICPKLGKARPTHTGLGLTSQVPLTVALTIPTKTYNLRSRVSYWLSEVEKGDEDLLFKASCVLREIVAEGLITPRVAVELLCGAWSKKTKPNVNVRRVIAAAWLTVEDKL